MTLASVQSWLGALTSKDASVRERAAATLSEGDGPESLTALGAALDELLNHVEPSRLSAALPRPRSRGGPPSRTGESAPDLVERLLRDAHPEEQSWCDLVSVAGLLRRLALLGTTPAVRKIVETYGILGEPIHREVDELILKLEDRALPALIEARKAEPKSLRSWAAKTLESLGKDVPGEAVQTSDDQVLVDVLLAYGRTKDADAARAVVSFANSDRKLLRDAARQSIRLYGEGAVAPVREAYENLTRRKPDESWTWDRLSESLFAELDRARLSDLHERLETGLARRRAGDLAGMATLFDQILARDPGFERRSEMAEGYLELAQSLRELERGRAAALVRKASRLAPATGPLSDRIEAERLYLEAMIEVDHGGLVDRPGLERAARLDPTNTALGEALLGIDKESARRTSAARRLALVGAAGLAAMAGSIALLLRRLRHRRTCARG